MKARFFALAALVLGLASCQQDFDAPVQMNGEVDFQLCVGAGEATRADLDGDEQEGYNSAYGAIDYLNAADWAKYDLRYSLEVYDVANDYTDATPVKDRMVIIVDDYQPVAFDLRLVPNRDYRFVVFADFVPQNASDDANTVYQSNLGLRHNIGDNLGEITIKADAINDEIADAYFAAENIKITNSAAQNIVLKRPYGKVRVIATDLAELNINVNPGKVQVEYEAFHPMAFNAVTGEVDGEYKPCIYACDYAKISKEEGGLQNHFYNIGYDAELVENANGVKRHSHMTLFTDYILAEKEGQTAYHFTMTVWDQNEKPIKETHFSTDIPVERNKLTTVVGNVLTTATEINITIDDNFEGKHHFNIWDGKTVKAVAENNGVYEIREAAELAWIAKQVNEGNKFSGKTVKLCKDIHLNGERWTPIGATGKFEGTFDGQNHVIEGLFVSLTEKAAAGLFANAKYVKNLKVCHAEVYAHYKAGVIVGDGLCSRITNCHVENATVVVTPLNKDDGNHAGGIVGYLSAENEAYAKDCSVKNAEIRGYRDVAAIAGTANQAAVVSGNKVEKVTVVADQTAEYVSNEKDGNAAAVAGRLSSKANIAGNTVANDVVVIRKVDSTKEMEYAVADAQSGDTIYVGNGEAALPHFENKALNFKGIHDNAAIAEPVSGHENAFWQGAELNFSNLKIKGTTYTGKSNGYVKSAKETYTNCKFVDGYYMFAGDVVTVDESVFTGKYNSYFWTGSADVITFNKCNFNGVERIVKVCTVGHTGVAREVNFNECTFAATEQKKAAIEIDGTKGSSYIVNINKCTESGFAKGEFTDIAMFNVEGAENVQVYLDGIKWIRNGVMEDENGMFAYNALGLQYLLDNAVNGETVKIGADIEGDVTVNQKADVKIAIEGDNHKFAGVITVDGKSATYTTAGVTIKNLNFEADAISADACIRLGNGTNATRYTCNVTVEGCTFAVPGVVAVKSYTGGDKNLTIKNCTATVNAHSLVQAKGIDGILVEECNVYSKNGLNFNNSDNVTVDQCNVDVKGYAVRYGESSGGVGAAEKYFISNSSLKSACDDGDAVVVLRGTADYAILNITNTTLDGTIKVTNKAKDAKVIIDGMEMVEAASQSELNDIIAAGNDVTVALAAGNYLLPSVSNGNVAISGGKDVVITINKPNLSGSDITLEGVTVNGSGYATGIQHVNTVTYNNVKVVGEMCLYGEAVTFNNCEFELASGKYIWTYGCKNVEFNNSTFNTAGKAILVYNEGAGANNVVVKGCVFNATEGAKAGAIANQNCAAIEIDNFQSSNVGAAHNVTASDNKFDNKFSGEWRIKNFVAGNAITVNGVAYEQIAIDGKLMTIDANKNVTVL